jgi:hypothetical protein
MIERLNYSTHAIEDFQKFFDHTTLPQTKKIVKFLITQLEKSVKFILPDCGLYFDRVELNQTVIDMLKLPFPVIAAEYGVKKPVIETEKDKPSTKRISLAIDIQKCPEIFEFFQLPRTNTILIWPLFYMDHISSWVPHHCGISIPVDQVIKKIDVDLSDEEVQLLQDFNAKSIPIDFDYDLLPLGEIYDLMKVEIPNPIEFRIRNFRDLADELFAILQLCMVLNCQNIETITIPAPVKLNKKRAEKKKLPLYEYKVLQISKINKVKTNNLNPTKISPRMHIRRGHPRRIFNENHEVKKLIWIESCIVGNKNNGILEKSYTIKKS